MQDKRVNGSFDRSTLSADWKSLMNSSTNRAKSSDVNKLLLMIKSVKSADKTGTYEPTFYYKWLKKFFSPIFSLLTLDEELCRDIILFCPIVSFNFSFNKSISSRSLWNNENSEFCLIFTKFWSKFREIMTHWERNFRIL